MQHLKKYWPIYVGLTVFGIILTLYIWNTSEKLPHLSKNRQDWNDVAEFVSFLVNPIIAIAAVYIGWVTYANQMESRLINNFELQLKIIMTKMDELKIEWESGTTTESRNMNLKSLSLYLFLSQFNILYSKLRKNFKNDENWLTFLQTLNNFRKEVFTFLIMNGFVLFNLENSDPKPEDFSSNFKIAINVNDLAKPEILKFLKSFDKINF